MTDSGKEPGDEAAMSSDRDVYPMESDYLTRNAVFGMLTSIRTLEGFIEDSQSPLDNMLRCFTNIGFPKGVFFRERCFESVRLPRVQTD